MDKEEKYNEIRDKLLNLEPVKASDDFVHNLNSKIVELESEKRREHEERFDEGTGGFLRNLFGNMQYPWLVPAAGFTILIFFIFYITFLNRNASDSNKDLLSTQKQETTAPQNTPPTQNNSTEKETDPIAESEKNKNGNEKIKDKDLASDLKTGRKEEFPEPVETQKKYIEKSAPKIYREETKPTAKQKTDETNGGLAVEKNQNEMMSNPTEETTEITTSQLPAVQDESKVGEEKTRSALSDDAKSNVRLKQKIDSLSKIDLKKLREEILK